MGHGPELGEFSLDRRVDVAVVGQWGSGVLASMTELIFIEAFVFRYLTAFSGEFVSAKWIARRVVTEKWHERALG